MANGSSKYNQKPEASIGFIFLYNLETVNCIQWSLRRGTASSITVVGDSGVG